MSESLVHGVDVSVYEPKVDWRVLRAQGFKFAFIRATSSLSYVDPRFKEHWEGARAAGILRGAYHYLFAGQDAKIQADHFIATVGDDQGELPPIVDLEDAYNEGISNRKIVSTCKKFLDIVEKSFGRTPMVYSRKTYLDAHVTIYRKAPVWAKNYELWLAQYPYVFNAASMPNVKMPTQPKGWKAWKFWQYTEKAFLSGVTDEMNRPTKVDLNWFRGTEAELYQFANVSAPKQEPYVVKDGDTFASIAEANGLTLTELLDANPSLPEVGSSLIIPGRVVISEPLDDTGTETSPPDDVVDDVTDDAKTETPIRTIHTVKPGETLLGIAFKYRTTLNAILAINPEITNPSIIFEGQKIKIP